MAAASMSVTVGNGTSCLLWTDNWAPVGPLCSYAPHLFAAISRRGKKRCLHDGLHQHRWARDITGAPTAQVLLQYLRVWRVLQNVWLEPLHSDPFVWKWSSGGIYTASSAYRAFFNGSMPMLGATELWETKAPARVKFFFWLVLHKRIWTADRRMRHGLQDGNGCILCEQEAETVEHLILGCSFTRIIWFALLQAVGLESLAPAQQEDVAPWWLRQRLLVQAQGRNAYSLLLLIAWEVWKERNNRTFHHNSGASADLIKRTIVKAQNWVSAGFSSLKIALPSWSQLLAVL